MSEPTVEAAATWGERLAQLKLRAEVAEAKLRRIEELRRSLLFEFPLCQHSMRVPGCAGCAIGHVSRELRCAILDGGEQ